MRISFKYIPLFIILICYSSSIFSQKLDHVLGEVIVEVRNDNDVRNLTRNLSSNTRYGTSLEVRQIMKEPMNLWVFKTDPNIVNEINFLKEITKQPQVLLAQKNHITQLRKVPNDPRFEDQWQYINTGIPIGVEGADIDMDLAWDVATGGLTVEGDTIVVCVIDDGANNEHPDLIDNIWKNHQEIPNNNIDDDGNGYIDDTFGWSATSDNGNVFVGGGHGMQVAGILGAKGNNEIGVAGVNWDVKLMIVRGGGNESIALASYAYPYTMRKLYNETNGEKGAFVVSTNASWGIDLGQPEDAPIWCDFYNKLGEIGIINFGATVNSNTNVDIEGDLPTGCESNYLVSVTNMNRDDEKVFGAGFGLRSVDLGAYGKDTYTITTSAYGGFGGTSAATPHVAGTAALLYSADCPDFIALSKSNPSQAALVIKDCILHGVVPNQSLLGNSTTGGKLNANNAIQNLMSTCGDCTQAFGSNVGEITDINGTLTWFDNGNLGITSIRYKLLSANQWIEVNDIATGYQFEGLNACESYEYQIKTTCASNPDAEYTYPRIFTTDGCCDLPEGITISLEGQMATIQWETVLAASNYIVEYKNVTDSVWITMDIGNQNSFILDGVLDCEFYEIRIQSKCASSNEESEFSITYIINGPCDGCTTDYCSFSIKDTSDEWIESVEIENEFENISGVDPLGYGSYLGQFDINLIADSTYVLTLTPGYTSAFFPEFFSAYIDYNQNGEFEEDESIYISQEPTMEAVSGDFTIPTNAINGSSRMRIVMRWSELNGPCDNGGFEFGEIEDYCVNIISSNDCPNSLTSMVADSTLSSLIFEFEQNDQVDLYLISYREKGTTAFDTVSSTTPSILINDLKECTEYEYRSGYICSGNTFFETNISEAKTQCEVASTDIEEDFALNVFPNPSYGQLSIEFNQPLSNEVFIELFTSEGIRAKSLRYSIVGESIISISTQELASGIYFVKISGNKKSKLLKWVKY